MAKKFKKQLMALLGVTAMTVSIFSGCGSSSSSSSSTSGDTIKIGSIHPLTGSYAYEGQAVVNAQQLAIDQINADGGIKALNGKKLELVTGDSQGEADTGASEAERLISQGCSVLTGTFQSSVTQTVMQKAEQNQIPCVVTVSNNVDMFEQGYKYSFRIQPNATVQAKDFIDYISSVKTDDIKTAVLINEDSQTGSDNGDIIESNIEKTGIKLVDRITYSASASSLSTEVTKIQKDAPDLLITIGYYADTSLLVQELNQRGVELKMVCGVANGGISDPKFITTFGDKVNNYLDVNYRYNPKSEEAQKLLSDYKEKYGDDMSVHAIYGYESIYLIAQAIENAGSDDPQKIRDSLATGTFKNHVLAQSDEIKFDDKGENVNAASVMVQIQDGKQVVVYPSDYAEAEIKYDD